jgi:hypothetical protein
MAVFWQLLPPGNACGRRGPCRKEEHTRAAKSTSSTLVLVSHYLLYIRASGLYRFARVPGLPRAGAGDRK